MSQIEKAIEIAQRDGNNFQRGLNSKNSTDVITVKYTQTKVFKPSEGVLKKNHILSVIDDDSVIGSYRFLRTRVLQRMKQNNWRTIGIVSTGKNAGKTLTAVNLGISIAMKKNHTALVVDADLRNPSVAPAFGYESKVGLCDYLKSKSRIENMFVNPEIDNFTFIPGYKRTQTSSELLSSRKMAQLVHELKTRYPARIVIFDLPPVLAGDDVVAFAPNLDAILLVVEEGETKTNHLKQSLDLLEGTNIIGAVLNKSKHLQSYEYYY